MRRTLVRRSSRSRRVATALLAPLLLGAAPAAALAAQAPATTQVAVTQPSYLIGAGIYDITGAVAETGAFGYANDADMTGLHERLYSHAFIVGDPATGKRVVVVSADLGAIFPSITAGVMAKLQGRYGDRYSEQNVMISASHTHAATSGLAQDKLYQVAGADAHGFGYDKRNLDTVVNGIYESIVRADANVEPGSLERAVGELTGATKNRSLPAYNANRDAAQASSVDTTMTQLTMTSATGRRLGLLNWFAVHPTSFSNNNRLISGDNKGFAQWAMERQMGATPTDPKAFVAAFANTSMGDVVASAGNSRSAPGFEGGPDDYVNAERAGKAQFDKALELLNQGGRQVTGGVDYRARWADFGSYTVGADYTQGAGAQRLCNPARGWSFAPGAENGPSHIPGVYEGMTKGTFSLSDAYNKVDTSVAGTLVRTAFSAVNWPWQDPCQAEKPVLLPDGAWGMAPKVLPVQLFRIGSVAIVAIPGEPTTMAGRRLRQTVSDSLRGTGVDTVVVASVANAYSGYLATREEYATQHYEGASTEFGPHELGAFQQEAARLATAIKEGSPVADGAQRPRIDQSLTPQRPGVVFDDAPIGQSFGQVLTQPEASYGLGQTASAVFRGAHPKNDFRTMGTFLKVQRLQGDDWADYLTDRDWDTSYSWKREGIAFSRTTVEWRIRDTTPAGTYRLVQTGDWKNGWTGKVSPYTGTSEPFTVG